MEAYGDLSHAECQRLLASAISALYSGATIERRIMLYNLTPSTLAWVQEMVKTNHRVKGSQSHNSGIIIQRTGASEPKNLIAYELGGKTYAVSIGERRKKMKGVIARDGNQCVWCSMELDHTHPFASLDHVIPASEGGSNGCFNSLLACETCNNARQTTPAITWIIIARARGQKVREDVIWNRLAEIMIGS